MVVTDAPPQHTLGDMAGVQAKVDSSFLEFLPASYGRAGASYALDILPSGDITKLLQRAKTQAVTLRWSLITNERVTFVFALQHHVPVLETVYQLCGRKMPH
jgi:hypothetical protein